MPEIRSIDLKDIDYKSRSASNTNAYQNSSTASETYDLSLKPDSNVITKEDIDFSKISSTPEGVASNDYVRVNQNYWGDDGELTYEKFNDNAYVIKENGTVLGFTSIDGITKIKTEPSSTSKEPVVESFQKNDQVIVGSRPKVSVIQKDIVGSAPESSWTGPVLQKGVGTVQGPSGRETYYNQPIDPHFNIHTHQGNMLKSSMDKLGLEYPRDYHVSENGVQMLGPYVMCAADVVSPSSGRHKGDIVDTSLGKAIIVDHCAAAQSERGLIDICVNW